MQKILAVAVKHLHCVKAELAYTLLFTLFSKFHAILQSVIFTSVRSELVFNSRLSKIWSSISPTLLSSLSAILFPHHHTLTEIN